MPGPVELPPPSGPQAALVGFAIRFRGVIVALACLLVGSGVYALRSGSRYDVFPEFAPPQVSIQTEAPGLASEQVEILVTQPIETAINGAPGVEAVRSASVQGLSVVTVIFKAGSDVYRARQVVSERLAIAAPQLPRGVQPPAMTPLTSSTSTVLVLGLTSTKRSLMEVRTVADWTVRRRLLAVPGVAKVSVFGGEVRSLQVRVRPDDLLRFNVGLNDVLAAARGATGIRGAGFIDTANQRVNLQTQGQSLTPEELARTVLFHAAGTSVTLGDVAEVIAAPEPPIGGATIMGEPGVILMVGQQYGSNTVEVTQRVEAVLRELDTPLARDGIVLHDGLFRPANFIQTAIGGVEIALLLGGVLVIVVLFLFLLDWRASAISCTAIPLSLLTALLVMQWMGETLNTMTLGGLSIAIGEVVDDAVIGVENISRRLRENRRLPHPRALGRVVLDAVLEVRSAVVYATFAVLLAFIPLLALSGVAGRLFAPLGIAYIVAVLASLAVALTVTPALAMLLLARRERERKEPPTVRWTRARYVAMLSRIERHPRLVIAAAITLAVAGAAALPFFGATFLPDLKEGHFVVHVVTVPGTSIDESLRTGKLVSASLRAIPAVQSVSQRVGRAEAAEDTSGTHYSEFEVELKPGLDGNAQESAEAEIRRALAKFPGVSVALKTFLTERVEETVSGFTASVVVNVFGPDLDDLDRTARQIADVLNTVPGHADVQLQSPPGMPQLTITLRKPDLHRWGFDPVEVLDAIRTAYQGDIVGQIYEGNRKFNLVVILGPEFRDRIARVGDLPLRTRAGTFVALREVADVEETSGRYQVTHLGGQRAQTVTANVTEGRDVASFVSDAKARIAAKVTLPPGSHVEFSGSAEAQAKSQRDLALNALAAGVGIVLLLAIATGHWRNLLLVLANAPFALVGGVIAVALTGGELSLGSVVGFVTLFGITLRNSIMMVSHYEHLVTVEERAWNLETAVEGAADRLAPILMTSLVTGLGLLPLAVGMGEPGREIEGPMAAVILGGLLTSMTLNLLVLPALALRYGCFKRGNAAEFHARAISPLASGSAAGGESA